MPSLNTILSEVFRDRAFMRDPWPAVRVSLVSNLALTFLYHFFAYVFASWLYPKTVSPAKTGEISLMAWQRKMFCVRLGKRLRRLRRQRGWTQTYLAVHTGLGRVHINIC